MKTIALILIAALYGCDAPKEFIANQVDEQVKTITPLTNNCYWHDGVYEYIVNEDKPDHIICNDGAEFDIIHQNTIYTDLFRNN